MASYEPDDMTRKGHVDRHHWPGLSGDVLGLRWEKREFRRKANACPVENGDLEVILVGVSRSDSDIEASRQSSYQVLCGLTGDFARSKDVWTFAFCYMLDHIQ